MSTSASSPPTPDPATPAPAAPAAPPGPKAPVPYAQFRAERERKASALSVPGAEGAPPAPSQPGAPAEPAVAPAEAAPKVEKPPEPATAAAEPEPEKGTIKARLAELTAHRRRAEEERDRLRAELDALKAAKPAEPKPETADVPRGTLPEADGEPKPEAFKTYEEYVRALARWEIRAEAKERTEREQRTKAQETHQQRIAKAHQKYPNLRQEIDEAVAVTGNLRNQGMEAALAAVDGEVLGDVLHHLATNLDDYRRIAALDINSAYREVVKLEMKYGQSDREAAPRAEPPKPPPISQAPPPIKTVDGPAVPGVKSTAGVPYSKFRQMMEQKQARQ